MNLAHYYMKTTPLKLRLPPPAEVPHALNTSNKFKIYCTFTSKWAKDCRTIEWLDLEGPIKTI